MKLPKDIEYICDEDGNKEEFVYSSSTQAYYKIFKKTKKIYGCVTGKNLINPNELERERLNNKQRIVLNGGNVSNLRIKCTPQMHQIWGHWQQQLNKNEDNNE